MNKIPLEGNIVKAEWIGYEKSPRLMVNAHCLASIQSEETQYSGTDYHAYSNGDYVGVFGSLHDAKLACERRLIEVTHLTRAAAPEHNVPAPEMPPAPVNPVTMVEDFKPLSQRVREKEALDAAIKEAQTRMLDDAGKVWDDEAKENWRKLTAAQPLGDPMAIIAIDPAAPDKDELVTVKGRYDEDGRFVIVEVL